MAQDSQSQNKKIVLPSSGLAEDILAGVEEGREIDREPSGGMPGHPRGGGDEDKQSEDYYHLVGFLLNSEEYALEITQVQEIIRVGGWTRVPNSPGHVKGVINLRGRIIPVVDPKTRMGLKESELTKDARIMVVETSGKVVGMLVDGVTQVLKLPEGVVEPPPEDATDADKGFVRGVGKMDARLLILLDLARVVGREDGIVVPS